MRRPRMFIALGLLLAATCSTPPQDIVPVASPAPEPTFVVEDPVVEAPASQPDGRRIVAAVDRRFRLFPRPGAAAPQTYTSLNDFDQELWLPVVGAASREGDTWFRVLVPERPNGRDAWVRERDVEVSRVVDRVVVDLSAHRLVHLRGDREVRKVEVAVGAPGTPTAPGRFFVWARVGYDDATGPYGNYALGLSGFSDVLTEWPGGGRMAIHGTSDPGDIGWDVSHGCVRVFNPQMARLIDIPMGATVVIKP